MGSWLWECEDFLDIEMTAVKSAVISVKFS